MPCISSGILLLDNIPYQSQSSSLTEASVIGALWNNLAEILIVGVVISCWLPDGMTVVYEQLIPEPYSGLEELR